MKQTLMAGLMIIALVGVGWSAYTIRGLQADVRGLQDGIQGLQADVKTVSGKTPSQSHTMEDVDYQFSNLWFAAKNANWPLAAFYLNETRSHLEWAVRVVPVRRLSNGQSLELAPILKTVEDNGIAGLKDAIGKQDAAGFEAAYRSMTEQCYSCHEAAEKPYLHPHIPDGPSTRMINMDPKADWP